MAEKNMNKPITIVGYVDAVDEDDKQAGIIITTNDDDEFLVELNKEGKRLMNMIGEQVQVSGLVKKIKSGEDRITVSKFEVLEYQETYEEGPEDY